jgi:hypothetical protein
VLEQELWERVGQVARDEGKTVDELTAEVLKPQLCIKADIATPTLRARVTVGVSP